MPSIATDDPKFLVKAIYKLDYYLLNMLVLHGREWFNWTKVGGGVAWYKDAVKQGYIEQSAKYLHEYRLTDKAMAYIRQLGEENEITQDNQRIHTSEAQGYTPTESSTSSVADWMA